MTLNNCVHKIIGVNIIIIHTQCFEYSIRKDSSQTKIVAPRTPFMIVTNATNCLTVVPKYFEIIAGIADPSFLKDMNSEKKSCVAPIKIVPKVNHLNSWHLVYVFI